MEKLVAQDEKPWVTILDCLIGGLPAPTPHHETLSPPDTEQGEQEVTLPPVEDSWEAAEDRAHLPMEWAMCYNQHSGLLVKFSQHLSPPYRIKR